jgi:predicted DCC family thiol-disulfide oxidoreductase YuxK
MKNLIIVYDDWCPYCIRFSKLIKKFDILRKISFFKLRKDSIDIENFDNNLALKKMASYKNGIWMYGFESIYRILKEIPLFWFFIPLFYFLKITRIGDFLYDEFAIKRKIIPIHCDENCKINY